MTKLKRRHEKAEEKTRKLEKRLEKAKRKDWKKMGQTEKIEFVERRCRTRGKN